MQEKWHSWFDYTWGLWIAATWISCGWFRERRFDFSPAAITADRWLLLGILFVSLCPVLWCSVYLFRRSSTASHPYQRASWSTTLHAILSDIFVACLLAASYGRVWTLAEIGFRTESPWNWTILFGLLCYLFFRLAATALDRVVSLFAAETPESFLQYVRYFVPRGRTAQTLDAVRTALLGPVHEELVYRGFLVFMLGNLTGHVGLAIVFGLSLCLTMHLYQGPRAIPSHLLFYAAVILIMYSPAGLLAALVMHVANNTHHVISLRGNVREYFDWLREQRINRSTTIVPEETAMR